MILVLLMCKLVMLDKIHRTNLYFVRYTSRTSPSTKESKTLVKNDKLSYGVFQGYIIRYMSFFILFWNEVKKPYSQRDTSKQSEFVNSWYIKYLLTKNSSVTRHVWLLKSSIIEKIGKKHSEIQRSYSLISNELANSYYYIVSSTPVKVSYHFLYFPFFSLWVNCILPHN